MACFSCLGALYSFDLRKMKVFEDLNFHRFLIVVQCQIKGESVFYKGVSPCMHSKNTSGAFLKIGGDTLRIDHEMNAMDNNTRTPAHSTPRQSEVILILNVPPKRDQFCLSEKCTQDNLTWIKTRLGLQTALVTAFGKFAK